MKVRVPFCFANVSRTRVCKQTLFFISDELKSELAREFGDRIQSRNVPLGTSDD